MNCLDVTNIISKYSVRKWTFPPFTTANSYTAKVKFLETNEIELKIKKRKGKIKEYENIEREIDTDREGWREEGGRERVRERRNRKTEPKRE